MGRPAPARSSSIARATSAALELASASVCFMSLSSVWGTNATESALTSPSAPQSACRLSCANQPAYGGKHNDDVLGSDQALRCFCRHLG